MDAGLQLVLVLTCSGLWQRAERPPAARAVQGNTALHHAVREGHKGVIALLIRWGRRIIGLAYWHGGGSYADRNPKFVATFILLCLLCLLWPHVCLLYHADRKKANLNTRNLLKSDYASGNWTRWVPPAFTPQPINLVQHSLQTSSLMMDDLVCGLTLALQWRAAAAAVAPDAAACGGRVGGGGACGDAAQASKWSSSPALPARVDLRVACSVTF